MGHGIDALYRLNVTFLLGQQNCLNTYWLRSKPNSPSVNLKEDTDTAILNWKLFIWPSYKAFMSNQVQLIAAVCTCVQPLNAAQTVAFYNTDFGSVVSEALPPHDAGLLSMYTGYAGRRVHGRLYIPGVPESLTAFGVLENSHVTKLANIGDALINNWGDAGTSSRFIGGVFSRLNGATRNPGPPPYISYSPLACVPWTRHIARASVKTQRHRLVGRGV